MKETAIANFISFFCTKKILNPENWWNRSVLNENREKDRIWIQNLHHHHFHQVRKFLARPNVSKLQYYHITVNHRSLIYWLPTSTLFWLPFLNVLQKTMYLLRPNLWFLFPLVLSLSSRQLFKVETSLFKWKHCHNSLNWWFLTQYKIPLHERKKVSFDDFFMMTWEREEKVPRLSLSNNHELCQAE